MVLRLKQHGLFLPAKSLNHRMDIPKNIPPSIDIPTEEEFEEYLEWTKEEEEEFLRILNDPENDGKDLT